MLYRAPAGVELVVLYRTPAGVVQVRLSLLEEPSGRPFLFIRLSSLVCARLWCDFYLLPWIDTNFRLPVE